MRIRLTYVRMCVLLRYVLLVPYSLSPERHLTISPLRYYFTSLNQDMYQTYVRTYVCVSRHLTISPLFGYCFTSLNRDTYQNYVRTYVCFITVRSCTVLSLSPERHLTISPLRYYFTSLNQDTYQTYVRTYVCVSRHLTISPPFGYCFAPPTKSRYVSELRTYVCVLLLRYVLLQ
jgi:hypothetical protein